MVREPLDVLASMVEAKFDKSVPADFAGKVEVYRSFVQSGLDYSLAHPATSTTVRYEELVASPEAALRAVLGAIGEAFEAAMLVGYADPDRGSGIEDPKAGTASSIHRESVGRGAGELADEEIRHVRERLGALAGELGYRAV